MLHNKMGVRQATLNTVILSISDKVYGQLPIRHSQAMTLHAINDHAELLG